MSKKYFAWKDPNCNGINPEWIEMNGNEYFKFIKKEENKGRKFVPVDCAEFDDDILYFESTAEKHNQWRKELKRKKYQEKATPNYTFLSFDYPPNDSTVLTLHELVADESVNIERDFFDKVDDEILIQSLQCLSNNEREVIIQKFWCMPNKSDEEIAKKLNMPQTTFSHRKKKGLEKIKCFFISRC